MEWKAKMISYSDSNYMNYLSMMLIILNQ